MIYIKPSAAIRNNYNEISQLCKETEQPVYITKNGEGDLVVMDIKAFSKEIYNYLSNKRRVYICRCTIRL